MIIDFPDNPVVGQIYKKNEIEWIWTGQVWDLNFSDVTKRRPIDRTYNSQSDMIDDQSSQIMNYLYFDGIQYWVYLGTTNETISDYRPIYDLISESDKNQWDQTNFFVNNYFSDEILSLSNRVFEDDGEIIIKLRNIQKELDELYYEY